MPSPSEFPAFFEEIHGHPPFPWQERLFYHVMEKGWPEIIALPTASGKTAIMDIGTFSLACQAEESPEKRNTPRRIAFVVDRRIVVDDAYRRAQKICRAIEQGETELLEKTRNALLSLGGEAPLESALLRGGIYREDRWARTPVQPVILCSTVDQVGSRLLFRGYGLSSKMWPLHAGLLGNDTLIVLDEAHCSRPFSETLEWIGRYRNHAATPLNLPFGVVTMTATPHKNTEPFQLDKKDHENPCLKKRLENHKNIQLVKASKGVSTTCMEILKGSKKLPSPTKKGRTLLVVVNRVRTAREIREKIREEMPENEALLLTGRSRPAERDKLLERHRERIMAGRNRQDNRDLPPLIVVATQCVEVGADIDADVLITEACPLDSFLQRLGRLDRLGELGTTEGFFVIPKEISGKGKDKPDPIYGEALPKTCEWLTKHAENGIINGGITWLQQKLPSAEKRQELCAPSPQAPIMFPAYCDLWAQTGPEPSISPDPAIFLHGPENDAGDIQLIWRGDIEVHDPGKILRETETTWKETISLCPPVTGEALALPIGHVRSFLERETPSEDITDLEGALETSSTPTKKIKTFSPVLRWRGPEESTIIHSAEDLRPGDVLILPASLGGCDEEGWNPLFQKKVLDIAELARKKNRRSPVLRMHKNLLYHWGVENTALEETLHSFINLGAEKQNDPEEEHSEISEEQKVKGLLKKLAENQELLSGLPEPAQEIIKLLNEEKHLSITKYLSKKGIIIQGKNRLNRGTRNFSDEDALSALSTRKAVLLEDHLLETEACAWQCASALPENLRKDVALAAQLHDLGKADPRFQTWLMGGNRIKALRSDLLAKSEILRSNSQGIEQARKKAGYPKGGRHELLSLRLAESCEDCINQANNRDLVLHLLASHHGHGRPFAPTVTDSNPVIVQCSFWGQDFEASSDTELDALDSGVAERFWKLLRQYGWWGLAYLESCLRLADHRTSEEPGKFKERGGKYE